jgi:phage head maturation protease
MTEVLQRRFGGGRIDQAIVRGPLELFGFESPDGPIVVSGLALPWGQTVELNWWGDTVEFARGSVSPDGPASRVKFLLDHMRHGMGYGLEFEDREAGLWARFAIPRDELEDSDTRGAVRQMRNGVRDALSVGVALDEFDEREGPSKYTAHLVVTKGHLFETSSVLLPRFDDARVESIAALPIYQQRTPVMTNPEPDPTPDDPTPDDDADDDVEASRLAQHLARTRTGRALAITRPRAQSRYASIGQWALAVAQGAEGTMDSDDRRRVGFALTDVTTGDLAGILPPTWVTDFAENLLAARPLITAFNTRPLPESGMQINWPKKTITGPLTGQQAAQKTGVTSGKVAITTENSAVMTYGGGNDVSIQAILRSDPSYLTILFEEYGYDLALNEDTDVVDAVLTAITEEQPLTRTAADINESLAAAARTVHGARRGAIPDRFVMGLDVWQYLAGAADADGRPLFPGMSGYNPVGTISLSTPTGEARGIAFSVDPNMPDDKAILGWSQAVTNWLGPVGTMSADVPSKLGRDVAIYQFMATAVRRPDALVELTLAAVGP